MTNAFDIVFGDVVLCIDSQMGRYRQLFRVTEVKQVKPRTGLHLHNYLIYAISLDSGRTATFYDDEIIYYFQQEIF